MSCDDSFVVHRSGGQALPRGNPRSARIRSAHGRILPRSFDRWLSQALKVTAFTVAALPRSPITTEFATVSALMSGSVFAGHEARSSF